MKEEQRKVVNLDNLTILKSLHCRNTRTFPFFDYSQIKIFKLILSRLGHKKVIKRRTSTVDYLQTYKFFLFIEGTIPDIYESFSHYFRGLVKLLNLNQLKNIISGCDQLSPLMILSLKEVVNCLTVDELINSDRKLHLSSFNSFALLLKCESLEYEKGVAVMNTQDYDFLCRTIVHSFYKEIRSYIIQLKYYFPQYNPLSHLINEKIKEEKQSVAFLKNPLTIPIRLNAINFFEASIRYFENKTGYRLENDARLLTVYLIEEYKKRALAKKDPKEKMTRLYKFVKCSVKRDEALGYILLKRGFFNDSNNFLKER